ncbi:MAG: hypothetical protein KDI04_15715 [Halieaceae bacterium]|nr:hypothetical protein [Halieaceae bacterium]MCP5148926.1 hypothetical protein [Pseudomonadales bacterium]MCP5165863.1 hypothetical protein [Pseudomonadales bacterium]MCP5188715.1 hypothetical protein [Pseudomonadales bacterium]MCP5195041.1 hypothetical protein [Pseudomonadales bacterium]
MFAAAYVAAGAIADATNQQTSAKAHDFFIKSITFNGILFLVPDSQWVSRLSRKQCSTFGFLGSQLPHRDPSYLRLYLPTTLQRPGTKPSSLKQKSTSLSPQQPLNRHPVIRFPALPARHQRPLRRVALIFFGWRVATRQGQ